jgi:protein-tyrosine phosphatase/arsenate reductase
VVDVVKFSMMIQELKQLCDDLMEQFDQIPAERKTILERITAYIQKEKLEKSSVSLVYVCTHNSRRSHFGQIWSKVAATYFGIDGIHTYSAGTESTAFHPNAIQSLLSLGFVIEKTNEKSRNPLYQVWYSDAEYVKCFSKTIDEVQTESDGFAAIMTCSNAEENCPFIPGAQLRISTTYEDPKKFDGTELESKKYIERSLQIALECLYVYAQLKK